MATKLNTRDAKTQKRFIEMGSNTNRRHLFNLSQAKTYMQTMLVASGATQLIEQGKTTSIRGLYYLLKHTIEGAKEETFSDQDECDPVIEDCEVLLNSLREELHLYAQKKGDMVGEIVLSDRGDEIDCARMGSGGYGIPSIVEPDVIEFKKCAAKFILHVEKDTVWQRFNEDKFWRKHKCILTHGGGQPPRGVRRLLHRLHNELKLPVYCLLDNDPWGYYIYSVIKQGSINLAYESQRMAIPEAKFIGLRSKDFEECQLSDSVKITLGDTDRKRAKQIAAYPWFAHKKEWQKEIHRMLENGFKLEVESLISKDISYVTEQYTPERLKAKDWLD
jgi:DNA topoisomerase-6 subunit A